MANKKLKGITYKGRIYTPVTADAVDDLRGFGDIGGIPSRNERVYLPGEQRSLPSSSYDIHVRISKEDLGLLEKLPESDDGLIAEFLERAHKKVLDTGHAECLSAEAEVGAVVNALQNFIHNDQAQLKDKAHASDMASYWKRNYVIKDTGSKPLQSREQPKLPPSSNVRMFSYKGANTVVYKGRKYVRVADERETPEYLKGDKGETDLWEVILDQAFSDLLKNPPKAVQENSFLPQMRDDIDEIEKARQLMDKAMRVINWKDPEDPGPRWLTDAFWDKELLVKLLDDPNLVRLALNNYIEGVNRAQASAQVINERIQDMQKRIKETGWASAYKTKKERQAIKKQLLKDFYGYTDSDVKDFIDKAYSQAVENAKKKKVPVPKKTEGKE